MELLKISSDNISELNILNTRSERASKHIIVYGSIFEVNRVDISFTDTDCAEVIRIVCSEVNTGHRYLYRVDVIKYGMDINGINKVLEKDIIQIFTNYIFDENGEEIEKYEVLKIINDKE